MTPEAEKKFLVAITNAVLALGVDAGFNDDFSLRIMKLAEGIGISKMDLLEGVRDRDT